MNSRERISAIIAGEPADRCGLWLGNPDGASWPGLHTYFGTKTEEELRRKLGDDLRWICPQFDQFILPWFVRFTKQAHAHGYQALLHSCGAIHKVIGRLIDADVDCLHPLQALAANMAAHPCKPCASACNVSSPGSLPAWTMI